METLKKGSRGEAVKTLQTRLNLIADGIFGPLTQEAVISFQKANGLTADGIVGAKTWAALGGAPNPRTIRKIIVHCTATPEGKDYSVAQIREWHTAPKPKGNGWADIGYHWVIGLDGTIYPGRPESKGGAHCEGHNYDSIGIVFVGGVDASGKAKDTRTPAQKAALVKLLKEKKAQYPAAEIYGHRDFTNKKACPSFDAWAEYRGI